MIRTEERKCKEWRIYTIPEISHAQRLKKIDNKIRRVNGMICTPGKIWRKVSQLHNTEISQADGRGKKNTEIKLFFWCGERERRPTLIKKENGRWMLKAAPVEEISIRD